MPGNFNQQSCTNKVEYALARIGIMILLHTHTHRQCIINSKLHTYIHVETTRPKQLQALTWKNKKEMCQ